MVTPPNRPADALKDAARIRSAVRLLSSGAANVDASDLTSLAADLLGAPHAHAALLTDVQVVTAGANVPEGSIGVPTPLEDSLCTLTAASGSPLSIPDAALDPRTALLPPVRSGAARAYLGVPLEDSAGYRVGVLCVYDPSPRVWTEQEEKVLARLARAVSSALELAAEQRSTTTSRTQMDLVLEVSGTGTWEMDLRTGHIIWDERCAVLFGFDSALSHDSLSNVIEDHIHPDDRELVASAVHRSIEEGVRYDLSYRAVHPSGEVRWLHARGHRVEDDAGVPVSFAGTVIDVTASRSRAEVELAAARRTAALAQVATRLATADSDRAVAEVLVEDGLSALGAPAGSLGVVREDGGGLSGYLLGYGDRIATEFSSIPFDLELPGIVAAREGRVVLVESPEDVARFRDLSAALEGTGTLSSASLPLSANGVVLGSVTVSWPSYRKVSPEELELLEALAAQAAQALLRVRTSRQRDEARLDERRSRERLELLVEAARNLALTLDVEEAVGRLAQLVVPRLADWSLVTLVDENGSLRDVGSWHHDETLRGTAAIYAEHRLAALGPSSLPRQALRSSEPLLVEEDATSRILSFMSSPDPAGEALSRLAPEAVGFFPLTARGRTVGLLSLYRSKGRPTFSSVDVEIASELASRAALALDNVRLYNQQRRLAEELQRSLLTAPPEPDHVEVAVRYQPAAQEAQVGGDWYDAFLQQDGSTVVVIGDVVGHDTQAAAAMGQLRGLLRGIAYTTTAGPSEVLSRLDGAIQGLLVNTMATAVVMRIEQTPEERSAGISRLRWSNAGHPPPLVLRPDGRVDVLDGSTTDLLLGILPSVERSEHEVVVERGSTVLMYTDGLVERRGQDLDAGIAALVSHFAALSDRILDEVCDGVLERMLPVESEDDVALVAVRLHPQDRPRPPEAGPNVVPPGVAGE